MGLSINPNWMLNRNNWVRFRGELILHSGVSGETVRSSSLPSQEPVSLSPRWKVHTSTRELCVHTNTRRKTLPLEMKTSVKQTPSSPQKWRGRVCCLRSSQASFPIICSFKGSAQLSHKLQNHCLIMGSGLAGEITDQLQPAGENQRRWTGHFKQKRKLSFHSLMEFDPGNIYLCSLFVREEESCTRRSTEINTEDIQTHIYRPHLLESSQSERRIYQTLTPTVCSHLTNQKRKEWLLSRKES